ncbi:MAG: hypothetical protein NPIRA04_30440 [Nitrospirales bacterium]|nr:MAG: hypothetical protein NPIRA04_30440 [Nitrospirales bacterium]
MESYPYPVREYLFQHIVTCRFPGYFYVSQDCHVLEAGGALGHYGLQSCKKGQTITEYVCFLHGLLPLNGELVVIPFVQFDAKHFLDLHLLPGKSGDWVLLLDATEMAIQQQRRQLAYYLTQTQTTKSSSYS